MEAYYIMLVDLHDCMSSMLLLDLICVLFWGHDHADQRAP
jgi:Ser/Thr protein kinase RdoA (MazF antagonist)